MLHEPAAPSGKDPASEYKKRLGVGMFIVYSAIYAGFVLINVISPLTMDIIVFLGLNLAVVYGFVTDLGGRIEVEQTGMTRFNIFFPCQDRKPKG
jgi:hypothetical protein